MVHWLAMAALWRRCGVTAPRGFFVRPLAREPVGACVVARTDQVKDSRYRKVPSARLSRLASFGQMAGGVAGGMLAEGVRRLASGFLM